MPSAKGTSSVRSGMTQESRDLADALSLRLADPMVWSDPPYGLCRALRRAAPIAWSPVDGSWIVSSYREAVEVLGSPRQFTQNPPDSPPARPHLAYTVDPPRHGQVRGVFSRTQTFTQGSVDQRFATLIRELTPIVRAAPRGRVIDAQEVLASPAATTSLAAFFSLSPELLEGVSARFTELTASGASIEQYFADDPIKSTFSAVIADRTTSPGNDPISLFIQANARRGMLNDDELYANITDMVGFGLDSLEKVLGTAVYALCEHPDQLRALQLDPDVSHRGADEVLRYGGVVQELLRYAAENTEIAEIPIARGDRVRVLICSANRDESVWVEPEHFDVMRDPEPPHLTLGYGIHKTPGASITKATIAAFLWVLGQETRAAISQGPMTVGPSIFGVHPRRVPVELL